MKNTLLGFLILQVIAWTFLFSQKSEIGSAENIQALSDTWKVVNVDNNKNPEVVFHYPTFNELTLNNDGSYQRLKLSGEVEQGSWEINEENQKLILLSSIGQEEFEIVQLPKDDRNILIIKEYVKKNGQHSELEYKLARL